MSRKFKVELKPLGVSFEVDEGTRLQDILFTYGVEFPCGGRRRCKGCKVKVLKGTFPLSPEQERMLTEKERSAGWRLACAGEVTGDLELELAQWEASILTDNSAFPFQPREGYGIAVDVGTTTIVGQLLDLATGDVLAVETALNVQARFGADIMERINFALSPERSADPGSLLREQIETIVTDMIAHAGVPEDSVRDVVIVGNTVMQHFFCGIDVEPLSRVPFDPLPPAFETTLLEPAALGWSLRNDISIRFLPSLGGFVGSDVLAGIVATGMFRRKVNTCLIDLGTNGEIVIGNRDGLVCASTAAGPAFEGARISMGMRASTGAISTVSHTNGEVTFSVIGGGPARGICGSGLVDAIAVGLRTGRIRSSGRLYGGSSLSDFIAPVSISQKDVRELQLAKGAIAAGIQILLEERGISPAEISRVYLAGAFGNYVNRESAQQIGLLPFPIRRIRPGGNTALLGAKIALFRNNEDDLRAIQAIVRHVPLSSNPRFMDIFAGEMTFPEQAGARASTGTV